MSVFLLLLLGATAGLAIDALFFDDETSDDGHINDAGVTLVEDGQVYVGTDSDEAYILSPDATGSVTANINAGGGDDVIDLASLFSDPSLQGSDISAGLGDDAVSFFGDENSVSGGDGNDTIDAIGIGNMIDGGGGDDSIHAVSGPGDPSAIFGQLGNDTIDVRGSDNVNVAGGEGDDLLMSDGRTTVGTGYTINIDGGAGNDTLEHSVEVFPLPGQDPAEAAPALTGGEGSDRFDISLTIGNGSFAPSDDDPESFLNQVAVIADFERGTDVLAVDIPSSLSGYTAETGTLTEDATAGTTTLNIALTGDLPTQNVQIIVATTGLTWNDVTFEGQTPTSLMVA